MPVFYDAYFIRVKSQKLWIIFVWKGFKYISAAVSISCIVIENQAKAK